MAAFNILCAVFFISVTVSLAFPLKDERESVGNVLVTEMTEVLRAKSADLIRIRRDIIGGQQCPSGQGMAPSGECAPCNGQNLPGCPDVPIDDDYEN